MASVVERADQQPIEHGAPPLPPKITPHSLRHTFASLLYALGGIARPW